MVGGAPSRRPRRVPGGEARHSVCPFGDSLGIRNYRMHVRIFPTAPNILPICRYAEQLEVVQPALRERVADDVGAAVEPQFLH